MYHAGDRLLILTHSNLLWLDHVPDTFNWKWVTIVFRILWITVGHMKGLSDLGVFGQHHRMKNKLQQQEGVEMLCRKYTISYDRLPRIDWDMKNNKYTLPTTYLNVLMTMNRIITKKSALMLCFWRKQFTLVSVEYRVAHSTNYTLDGLAHVPKGCPQLRTIDASIEALDQ